jgi:hypothetical protein
MFEKINGMEPEKIRRAVITAACAGLAVSLVFLIPFTRAALVNFAGGFLFHRNLDMGHWNRLIFTHSLELAFAFIVLLLCTAAGLRNFINKRISLLRKLCIGVLVLLVIASIGIRIRMYADGWPFWGDEGALAHSIVTRDFFSLVSSPLAGNQTAPVLYLFVVKFFRHVYEATGGGGDI